MADTRLCSIDGCGKPSHARGWCGKHLYRWRKHGDPMKLADKPSIPEFCSVTTCGRKRAVGRKGFCEGCYQAMRRYGDPEKRICARRGEPMRWLKEHVNHSLDSCLIWPFAKHRQKGEAVIQDRRTRQAARLMCILAHGEPVESDSQAAHECGNGHLGCVNPRHLSWKSPKENTWDKFRHGTMRRGETAPQSKLTESQVKVIRSSVGLSEAELAQAFGVHVRTIADVLARRTWAWL